MQPLLEAKNQIKVICFDIETIFETNENKAANYVGRINSLLYLKETGHLPCQKDLFTKLSKVPATTTLITYNNDLQMPLIFSDWLINTQPAVQLLKKITSFLHASHLASIEQKIFENITTMMLTPTSLVDTQKVISGTTELVSQLRNKGYKVYLTGNWAHLESLQSAFAQALKLFHGIFVSGKMHQLKPHPAFYETILTTLDLDTSDILWIEKEVHFATKAKQLQLPVLKINPKNLKQITQDLQTFGIYV